jgi:ferredoxin-NADP reductase
MPAQRGDIALVYRATRPEDVVFRDELERLARERGTELHFVLGPGCELSHDALVRLIPDIAERDAYVCGPPGMVDGTRASLLAAGLPARHILTERFAL